MNTVVYTPPDADVFRIRPRNWDHHLYVAWCRTCGTIATANPADHAGTPALAAAAARAAAHAAAGSHNCTRSTR